MPKLAEFEFCVLKSVISVGEEFAYGAGLQEAVQEMTRKAHVSLGAIHTTLNRLEEKGFAESYTSEPTRERGGRAKRIFKITGAGRRALYEKEAWFSVAAHGSRPTEVPIR